MKTHAITSYVLTNGKFCGEDPWDNICSQCHVIDTDDGGSHTRQCQLFGDHLRFDWTAKNVLRCEECLKRFTE